LVKSFLKPSQNLARVITVPNQEIIGVIVGFCINCNNFYIWIQSAIRCLEYFWVVTINHEFFYCIFRQPRRPLIAEKRNNWVLLVKVLRIYNLSKIMITLNRVSSPLIEIFLHEIKQKCLIIFFIRLRIVPLVMRRDITSPKQNIWSQLIDFIRHFVKQSRRYVTKWNTAIRTCLISWVFWESVLSSTAQNITTIFTGTNCIIQVNVKISELYKSQSFSWGLRSRNLLVKFILEFIIFYVTWFAEHESVSIRTGV